MFYYFSMTRVSIIAIVGIGAKEEKRSERSTHCCG
jgi:hypothetical protein